MRQIESGWAIPEDDTFFEDELNKASGRWERDVLDAALAYVKDFTLAIDGGAHIGTRAIPLAERFTQVLAFEPDPENLECLRLNTAKRGNILTSDYALGERAGKQLLLSNTTNTGMNHILPAQEPTPDHFVHSVNTLAIDSLDLFDVGLIKLDLEGYELFALKGAEETIKRCQPVLVLELWHFPRYGLKLNDIRGFLDSLGYIGAKFFQDTKEVVFIPMRD
jgi:FkbM family methyltransferase